MGATQPDAAKLSTAVGPTRTRQQMISTTKRSGSEAMGRTQSGKNSPGETVPSAGCPLQPESGCPHDQKMRCKGVISREIAPASSVSCANQSIAREILILQRTRCVHCPLCSSSIIAHRWWLCTHRVVYIVMSAMRCVHAHVVLWFGESLILLSASGCPRAVRRCQCDPC